MCWMLNDSEWGALNAFEALKHWILNGNVMKILKRKRAIDAENMNRFAKAIIVSMIIIVCVCVGEI